MPFHGRLGLVLQSAVRASFAGRRNTETNSACRRCGLPFAAIFVARAEGAHYNRLARAHGYVDGFMRALLESGHCTKQELLELVALERAAVSGPATREIAVESITEIAAA